MITMLSMDSLTLDKALAEPGGDIAITCLGFMFSDSEMAVENPSIYVSPIHPFSRKT